MSTISSSTTSTTAYKVTADTTGTLVLQTGATPTTAVTIDTSQNVGIGTASPTNKLDVAGSIGINNGSTVSFKDSGGTYRTTINWDSGNNINIGDVGNATASILKLFAGSASGQTLFYGNNTERMRIDTSGNVGIGTSSPGQKLQVESSGTNYITTRNSVSGGIAGLICQNGSDTRGIRINNADLELYDFSAGVARATIDSSGNFKFNSGYGSVATAYGCRAWVNFNGTGTVAIRSSGNVTSITDNGVGDYTVNLTNAMPDANYSICGAVGNTTNSDKLIMPTNLSAPTTSAFRIGSQTTAGAYNDNSYVWAAIFR